MRPGDWIQLGSLIVAAIGLRYLVRYVEYTKRISEEAVTQTEASFKPAVIAIRGQSMDADSKLRNIGKGPALDVEWRITGTNHKGHFGFIDVSGEGAEIPSSNLKALVNGALKSPSKNDVAIACSYKSISGRQYTSVSKLAMSENGAESDRFDTTFGG